MGAVPLSPRDYPQGHLESRGGACETNWMRIGAASTLLTGSLLLMAGKRRAGLVVSAAGAALAMVEEKDLVKQVWEALPGYLDTAQRLVDQVQETIDDIAAKRDKVVSIFGK